MSGGYTGRMSIPGTIVQLLTWSGRTPVLTGDLTAPDFRCSMTSPKRARSAGEDSSPRELPSYKLQIASQTTGVDVTVPTGGSTVRVRGVEYEVLSDPRELISYGDAYAYEASVLPVTTLYPQVAAVAGVGGTESGPEVLATFSLWSESEGPRSRGEYEELRGEAPVHLWTALRETNVTLVQDDAEVLKVTSALLNLESPHVALRLRRRAS